MSSSGTRSPGKSTSPAPGPSAIRRVEWWRAWSPLLLGLAVYALCVYCTTQSAMKQTGGRLIYTLDDAYIHLAIVKNLVHHGVWGVTPYEFTAASSSPLWVVLLALVSLVVGVREQLPYLVNLLMGGALLLAAYLTLRRMRLPLWYQTSILLLLVVATPLAPLVLSGMEHLFHTTLLLLFVACLLPALAGAATPLRTRASQGVLLLAPLLVLARFESLFFLGIVSVLLLLRQRRRLAGALAILTLAPLLLTGVVQRAHGGYWLPNSLLNKSPIIYDVPSRVVGLLLNHAIAQFSACPEVTWVLVATLLVLMAGVLRRRAPWSPGQLVALCYILTTLLHMTFARVGWFYRYEAYLVVFGIVILAMEGYALFGPARRESGRRSVQTATGAMDYSALVCGLCGLCLLPLGQRALRAHENTPRSARHIYLQQYQMGRFISTYYRQRGVFVNDIGAICYLTDVHLLDYLGLGTTAMLTASLRHQPLAPVVGALAQQREVKIAIFYESVVLQNHPATWVRLGSLQMNAQDCYWNSPVVAIYATTPAEVRPMLAHLQAFASRLPAGARFVLEKQ